MWRENADGIALLLLLFLYCGLLTAAVVVAAYTTLKELVLH